MSAKFWTLLEVIPNLTLILVLGFGAYAAGHGLVTMGTLVAFITMMLSLVWPIASLGFLLSMTQEAMTAANRVAEIFDAPIEITDGPRAGGAPRRPPRTRRRRIPVSRFRRRMGPAPRQPHRRTGGDAGPGRRDRFGQVGAHGAAVASLRRHRGRHPHRRRRHPRPEPARAAPGRGHRVRGSDAVLDVGGREPPAGPIRTTRVRRGAGHRRRHRRGGVRLRPAVRPGHPHRRTGHEPVRRSAATAFAGPGDRRGARRSWCSTTRCRRSTCTPRPS